MNSDMDMSTGGIVKKNAAGSQAALRVSAAAGSQRCEDATLQARNAARVSGSGSSKKQRQRQCQEQQKRQGRRGGAHFF